MSPGGRRPPPGPRPARRQSRAGQAPPAGALDVSECGSRRTRPPAARPRWAPRPGGAGPAASRPQQGVFGQGRRAPAVPHPFGVTGPGRGGGDPTPWSPSDYGAPPPPAPGRRTWRHQGRARWAPGAGLRLPPARPIEHAGGRLDVRGSGGAPARSGAAAVVARRRHRRRVSTAHRLCHTVRDSRRKRK